MKKTSLVLLILIVVIQFIPIKRNNPTVTADFNGPADVKEIMQASCYDCHSNETNWPWYSKVAPVSWLIAHHVNEGREHINFSNWQNIPSQKYPFIAEYIWEVIEKDEMPMKMHTLIHKDAVLSDEQKEVIKTWSDNLQE